MSPPQSAAPEFDARQVPDPAHGSGSFMMAVLQTIDPGLLAEALQDLRDSEVEREPPAVPELSGMEWIRAHWDYLRMLPFTASSDGSDTRPPVRARDVALSARIRRRAAHLMAATGTHWPTSNRITVTADPEATRAEVSVTMLHELVHAATEAPISASTGRRLVHGTYFRLGLIEAAQQAYGVDLPRGAARWRAAQVDKAIVRALEALGGEWGLPVGT